MKTIVAVMMIAACGTRQQQSDPEPEKIEIAPDERVCGRIRSCGLLTDSADDVQDCTTCTRWLMRYFDEQNYDWRTIVDSIDSTSCEDVKSIATYYKFFACI